MTIFRSPPACPASSHQASSRSRGGLCSFCVLEIWGREEACPGLSLRLKLQNALEPI